MGIKYIADQQEAGLPNSESPQFSGTVTGHFPLFFAEIWETISFCYKSLFTVSKIYLKFLNKHFLDLSDTNLYEVIWPSIDKNPSEIKEWIEFK